MGYNWAGLGSALGQGIAQPFLKNLETNQGLDVLGQKIKYLTGLPSDQQGMALSLLGGQKSDPLSQILGTLLAQQFGLGPTQSGNEIKVRQKSTGEIGTIPDKEFDPKLYERVE